jgi:hypothetical protein
MLERSRLIRTILTILTFFAVLSGGVLIGQVHGYRRHMSVAMESLRTAQHSVHDAIRDGGGRHSRMALEHIEIAIREVQEDLR